MQSPRTPIRGPGLAWQVTSGERYQSIRWSSKTGGQPKPHHHLRHSRTPLRHSRGGGNPRPRLVWQVTPGERYQSIRWSSKTGGQPKPHHHLRHSPAGGNPRPGPTWQVTSACTHQPVRLTQKRGGARNRATTPSSLEKPNPGMRLKRAPYAPGNR